MSSYLIRPQTSLRQDVAAAGHGIVRVAALLGASSLLRDRGIEPADALASVGLDPGTLDDAENCIPYTKAGQLLQRCVEATGCIHFGLLVGQHANVSSLGMLGELMRRAPSVQSALRSLILHLHLQTRGGMPTHSVEGGNATLGYAIYQRDMPGAAQVYDLVLACGFNIMQALCGLRWLPSEVSFSHTKPKDVRPYRQFFGSALRFDADRAAIVFSETWLNHAPPDSNADLHRALQRKIAAQEMLRPDDQAERIRRALRTMVLTGRASETLISKLLSIPGRTLRRTLAAQGTNFRELLEQGRYEIARQLLADTDMTTAEIAETLDYADASAFTRAFRRWTDSPPATWRAKTRSAEEGKRRMSSRT
jgi:AraC-like DNA-binding protein